MKKALLPSVVLCLVLLAGCGTSAGSAGAPSTQPPESPADTSAVLIDQAPWFATFRVVAGAESGELVLAASDGTSGEVYILNTEGLSLDGPVENGELINVYYDAVLESFPCRFSNASAVEHTGTERDDRCGLYLQVLEDLWEVDSGLNTNLEELGVDFSGLTDLSDSEKAALTWAFGNAHGLTPITGTLEEIWEEGYLTPMTEPAEGYEDSVALYGWEGGCLFTLSGSADGTFRAEKWASGLGAYVFGACTAKMGEDGSWTYTVGAEAIS